MSERWIRTLSAKCLLRALHLVAGEHPVPLLFISYLRWIAGKEIAKLCDFQDSLILDGSLVEDDNVRRLVAGYKFSLWSLDVSTINFLIKSLRELKPTAILEFGSGISTICFTRIMVDLHQGTNRVFVYSIEQDEEVAFLVRERLREAGLDRFARVLHAPLIEQAIEGKNIPCYSLPPDKLSSLLTVKPNFIIVDGPSGKKGARFGTLPLVREYVQDQAIFFLDDGLRDEELAVAQQWTKLTYIHVRGVHLLGKGLISGRVSISDGTLPNC
ncbi:MAG: class I SAM-dependent methyltransferase [Anaerolineae bacterium]|nr:class I SAM-dependent methyltransferase [Anaerolineae bacterium]